MTSTRNYRIDLWLFIGSITVLLYLLMMNIMQVKGWRNDASQSILDIMAIPLFAIGTFIPLIVVYRGITKKTESRSLAILTMMFSLLTGFLIGYTTLL